MAEIFVTEEELSKGIALASGQRWRVVVTRTPTLARVFGKAFNTNRSQLLAGAARKLIRIRSFLQEQSPTHLLIVGHCDTTGDDAVNDPLSLERADNELDPKWWRRVQLVKATAHASCRPAPAHASVEDSRLGVPQP